MNKCRLTKRDYLMLEDINKLGSAAIKDLVHLFPSGRTCQNRLKKLFDNRILKREWTKGGYYTYTINPKYKM